jgi:hypothetical protein
MSSFARVGRSMMRVASSRVASSRGPARLRAAGFAADRLFVTFAAAAGRRFFRAGGMGSVLIEGLRERLDPGFLRGAANG